MPGQSLQHRLDEAGPLSVVEVLRIGSQIASGLAAAHAQGLVHRDIKPANILLEQGIERVAITDFGLARAIDDASLTRTGVLAGTPAYMSPEQARGETVDHRADLFSLGSVMYAMCAGRPPFRAESTVAVLKRICEEEPTPLAQLNVELPPWLARIIARLHSKSPADRISSAAEVADLLQRSLAHVQNPSSVPLPDELVEPPHVIRPRRMRKSMMVLASLAILALANGTLWRPLSNLLTSNEGDDDRLAKPQSHHSNADLPRPPSGASSGRESPTNVLAHQPKMTEADYELWEARFKQGTLNDPERLYEWSLRLLKAQTSDGATDVSAALRGHLERMRRLEQQIAADGRPLSRTAVEFYRQEAEMMVSSGEFSPVDVW
jgi:serine/threonine protein kinase